MSRIESTLVVSMMADEAFAFLNQCESHRRFIPRLMELQQTSPGDFGKAGTTLAGTLNYFGIRIPVQYEISEVQPNRALAMNGKMGPFDFTDGYLLSQNSNGTQIRFWLDLRPTGWARAFSPLLGLIGRIHAWETLRNLRRELHQEMASSAQSLH